MPLCNKYSFRNSKPRFGVVFSVISSSFTSDVVQLLSNKTSRFILILLKSCFIKFLKNYLSNCFPDEYAQCLQFCQERKIDLHDAEMMVFGFNHQYCGYIIANKWKLNDNIISAMEYHHSPEKSDKDHRLLISSVAIADVYANIFEIGSAGSFYVAEDQVSAIIEQSSISWEALVEQHENIQESIEKASVFLQVS